MTGRGPRTFILCIKPSPSKGEGLGEGEFPPFSNSLPPGERVSFYAVNYRQASSVTRSSIANLSLYLPVLMAKSVSKSLS
jgi:hypothetical protein